MSEGGVKISRRQFPAVLASLTGVALGTYYGFDRLREVKENKLIDTPEEMDGKLKELSQKDIGELVRNGELSPLAVSSTVKINLDYVGSDGPLLENSNGSVFYGRVGDERYWFVHTAGHTNEFFGKGNMYLKRKLGGALGLNDFRLELNRHEYGSASTSYGYFDYGCFAIPANSGAGGNFGKIFAPIDVIYTKDIAFNPPKLNARFNSFSYTKDLIKVSNTGMKFGTFEAKRTRELYGHKNLVLDNAYAQGGFSGTHIFETGTNLCSGILTGGVKKGSLIYSDNINFVPYSDIGMSGIDRIHEKAVEDLKRK